MISTLNPPAPLSVILNIDDKRREAYRLHKAGMSKGEIAKRLNCGESTIYRYLNQYRESYRKRIETTPSVHLIAEFVAGFESIEREARKSAENTKSEKEKNSYLNTALKAMKAHQQLLTECGVIPKEPEHIYNVVQNMKLVHPEPAGGRPKRSQDEIIADIMKRLENHRSV